MDYIFDYVLAAFHPFLEKKYCSLKTSEVGNWPFSLCSVFKSYFCKILLPVILNLSVIWIFYITFNFINCSVI